MGPEATKSAALSRAIAEPMRIDPPPMEATVVTRMIFGAAPAQVWKELMFYEQLKDRPPLLLRFLLPVPIRTEGAKLGVGDEAVCRYEKGYLLKRVTAIDPARYEFVVAEQHLQFGGGLRLSGGSYSLRELPDGRSEVQLTTRYESPRTPRWLWKPIEAAVCHLFHRYILGAIRREAEAGSGAVEGVRDLPKEPVER